MKKRNLVIGLLITLAVAVSGFTFAYWASSVTAGSDVATGTVTIGTGDTVQAVVLAGADQTGGTAVLVPNSAEITATPPQVKTITLSYTVEWKDNALLTGTAPAPIVAAISNIKVGTVANPHTLISVTPVSAPATIVLGGTVTFTFDVTMGVPANLAQYNDVAGKVITFDVTFTVTPLNA